MDATLQLIMDQFRELKSEICTITAELKTDMRALGTGWEALKSVGVKAKWKLSRDGRKV
jgi:hypothetical protein